MFSEERPKNCLTRGRNDLLSAVVTRESIGSDILEPASSARAWFHLVLVITGCK